MRVSYAQINGRAKNATIARFTTKYCVQPFEPSVSQGVFLYG